MKKLFTLALLALLAVSAKAQTEEQPIYTAWGQICAFPDDWADSGWAPASCMFVGVDSILVEAYNGYTILRGWCGVAGYDQVIIHTEGDSLEWASIIDSYTIVNGEEKPYASGGYYYAYTGREDYPMAAQTLSYNGYDYSYINSNWTDKEGSLIISQYISDASNTYNYDLYNYYLVWGSEATAISTLRREMEDGATYNLFGQKVGDDYKGLVIRNGRKYLNR